MTEEVIVSTRERPGTYDGIESLKPGEPIFGLQGGDPLSPPLIQLWAAFARVRAGLISAEAAGARALGALIRAATENPVDPKKRERLQQRATAAEEAGWTFQAYLKGHEAIEGKRALYSDQLEVEADAERTVRVGRIKAAERLNNQVAAAQDVADELARLAACPEAEAKVREAQALLREAALSVEPRRGLERS
jgi:hypothetical protein